MEAHLQPHKPAKNIAMYSLQPTKAMLKRYAEVIESNNRNYANREAAKRELEQTKRHVETALIEFGRAIKSVNNRLEMRASESPELESAVLEFGRSLKPLNDKLDDLDRQVKSMDGQGANISNIIMAEFGVNYNHYKF